jgi:ABC-type hemin transport system ATPase subunit
MCKDANAILIIGRTGAGKSTLMTALSGTSLVYVPGTKDYRASNPAIAELIPVSNKH